MNDGGRLLTILGWFMIVGSLVVAPMLMAKKVPSEIATWWTVWNVFVVVSVIGVGVLFVVWGNRLRARSQRD